MSVYIKVKRKKIELYGYAITNRSNNIVKVDLTFKDDSCINSVIGNGFKLYDGDQIYDFSDCIYQYNINNKKKNGISMTNLKDYYDKPIIVTDLQKKHIIESTKKDKIAELSETCNKIILHGVDVEINSNIEHFSYDLTDQINIDDIFHIAVSTGLPQLYHCDGGSLCLYEVDEIKKIYITQKINKFENTTYFNQLKQFILSLDDQNTIENIKYGDELSDVYLDIYNNTVERYKTTLLSFANVN